MEHNKIQQLLEKYLDGATTVSEESLLRRYFEQQDTVHADFRYAQAMFAHFTSEQKDYFKEQTIRSSNNRQIQGILLGLLTLLVSIVIGLFYFNTSKEAPIKNPTKQLVFYNNTDSIQKIHLNKHTTIWLNKNCKISYPATFGKQENTIIVEGEAFLETSLVDSIKVLAYNALISVEQVTAFNIKAEKEAESVEITVKHGSVKVADNSNLDGLSLLVTEGNYCSVHKSSKMVFAAANTNNNYLAWLTGEFIFDHIPLATVTDVLERYFHVKVTLDDRQLAYCEITGTFKTKSIDNILNSIKSELNFEITNAGNVITISGKDCS